MINLKKYNKVLTFFAHPDDETLAAGALIHKLTNLGVEILICSTITILPSGSISFQFQVCSPM